MEKKRNAKNLNIVKTAKVYIQGNIFFSYSCKIKIDGLFYKPKVQMIYQGFIKIKDKYKNIAETAVHKIKTTTSDP